MSLTSDMQKHQKFQGSKPSLTCTISLPQPYQDAIEILLKEGLYPSRSEIIRTALRDFLQPEIERWKNLPLIEEIDPSIIKIDGKQYRVVKK